MTRTTGNHADRVFASPLARRLARERGVDLAKLHGSGPRGRVVKRDIEHIAVGEPEAERAKTTKTAEAKPNPDRQRLVVSRPPAQAGLSDEQVRAMYEPGSYELVPHDTMRRIIAERLDAREADHPAFLSVDRLQDRRAAESAQAPQRHDATDGPRAFRISVNDFIIKALAMALQQTPRANAIWTEEGLLLHRSSDIAVAVALPGGGLFTPVVRNAELKSLSEISNEMRDLAARARSKRLAPHEYQGGTSAISNLGMYGIAQFDAVINPPQASILAVGKAEKRPIVKNDKLKIATMMSVTLSVDHRVIDGALGAELLAAFKSFIEDPVTMLALMEGPLTLRPASEGRRLSAIRARRHRR